MCIGLPMRVIEVWPGGALVAGRGRREPIDTRLVGGDDLAKGEWLLVFQGAARERLDAQRALEIDATLDLLEAALAGEPARAGADAAFALPSDLSAAQVAQLTGRIPTRRSPGEPA